MCIAKNSANEFLRLLIGETFFTLLLLWVLFSYKEKNEKWFFNHLKYILKLNESLKWHNNDKQTFLMRKKLLYFRSKNVQSSFIQWTLRLFLIMVFIYVIILLSIVNMICNIFCFISRIWNITQKREFNSNNRHIGNIRCIILTWYT